MHHKIGNKCKYSSKSREVDEVDETTTKKKGLKWQQKKKLKPNKVSQDDEMVRNIPASLFASFVPENVGLVYLKRRLVQKLLKQPESFADKVKGAFVRVQVPPNGVNKRKAYKLVQVTGIMTTSSNGDNMDIKLQALNMPNDISIDMLSDGSFSEQECEELIQQVKVGLLKKPTVEELEEKAKSLHEDMVDDFIAMELKKLQAQIDHANEKGRRRLFFMLLKRKEELQAPSERLRLIYEYPKVIADAPNDRQGIEGSPDSTSVSSSHWEQDKTASAKGSLFERLSGAFVLAQEHERKKVKETMPWLPIATDAEEDIKQKLPEIKQEKVIQEKHTDEELLSFCDQLNDRMFVVHREILHRREKILEEHNRFDTIHQKLEMNIFEAYTKINAVEDELKRLKVKMEAAAQVTATEITCLNQKLNQMFKHHDKQVGEAQDQSAKEAITSHKTARMFGDDVSKLLEAIYNAGRSKGFEEVRIKHLPDLDLSKFPRYDPKAGEKVNLLLAEIGLSHIQVPFGVLGREN